MVIPYTVYKLIMVIRDTYNDNTRVCDVLDSDNTRVCDVLDSVGPVVTM